MKLSRRQFFVLAGVGAGGALLFPLYKFYTENFVTTDSYGPLQPDPKGVLDLPAGFSYVRLSETGQMMTDGYKVPGGHDGMAAFAATNGNTILVRNHELAPASETTMGAPEAKKYDATGKGGTTTLEITPDRTLVRHFGSLAGTDRNCAGGPTPWGSWLTCEESVEPGNQKHGYVFEVPAGATELVDPVPLVAMGRFNHEAAAVDPATGDVYMTEDRKDGLLYRFVPNVRNRLSAGGTLYALKVVDSPQAITATEFPLREPKAVEWVKIDVVDPDTDTVRVEGFSKGAAQFSRGEGIFYGNGEIYVCSTSGGKDKKGQIWRYLPARDTIELYVEPNKTEVLKNPDNIVVAPNKHVFLCEDGEGTDFVVGINPRGGLYPFARNALNDSEFAGVCFSPDGKTMFVNMQTPGITFAVSGPW